MPHTDHILERRSYMLAERIGSRIDTIRNAVAPEGTRPPFSEQLSKPEALRWWKEHFHDDLGQRVKANMTPEAQMELTQALSKANEADMTGEADVTGGRPANGIW